MLILAHICVYICHFFYFYYSFSFFYPLYCTVIVNEEFSIIMRTNHKMQWAVNNKEGGARDGAVQWPGCIEYSGDVVKRIQFRSNDEIRRTGRAANNYYGAARSRQRYGCESVRKRAGGRPIDHHRGELAAERAVAIWTERRRPPANSLRPFLMYCRESGLRLILV